MKSKTIFNLLTLLSLLIHKKQTEQQIDLINILIVMHTNYQLDYFYYQEKNSDLISSTLLKLLAILRTNDRNSLV